MSENLFKCENCGAEYTEWRTYCRKCQEPLPKRPVVIDETLEGESKEEIYKFIGSNQSRYYNIFKAHKGKFKFNNMNWAAFFFGIYWMFYRKMYKNGIALFFTSIGLAVAVAVLSLAIVIPQLVWLDKELGVYGDYVTESKIDDSWFEDGTLDMGEYMHAKYKYEQKINSLDIQYNLLALAPGILINIYVGLRADSMYKKHVFQNITNKDKGGTSGWSVLLAGVIELVGTRAVVGAAALVILILIALIV